MVRPSSASLLARLRAWQGAVARSLHNVPFVQASPLLIKSCIEVLGVGMEAERSNFFELVKNGFIYSRPCRK